LGTVEVGTSRRSEISEARAMEPTKEAEAGAGSGVKLVTGPVVQIDEGRIQAHLDEVVRSTVEETLNALLDAEADRSCGVRKYERSEGRKDTRVVKFWAWERRKAYHRGESTCLYCSAKRILRSWCKFRFHLMVVEMCGVSAK
jgi:hypothetical protein